MRIQALIESAKLRQLRNTIQKANNKNINHLPSIVIERKGIGLFSFYKAQQTSVSNRQLKAALKNKFGEIKCVPKIFRKGFKSVTFPGLEGTPKSRWNDVTSDGRNIFIKTADFFKQGKKQETIAITDMITDYPSSKVRR